MAVIFKRLFEVRVLHGYYLDYWLEKGGAPALFYDYHQDEQNELLESRYDIRRDLHIEPTAVTLRQMKGLGIQWRPTPMGLLIGLEVNIGANGTFAPKADLPTNLSWTFVLRTRNPYLYSITNHALRATLPAIYYFTNRAGIGEGKKYPSLSTLPPNFSPRTWEMGELIRPTSGVLTVPSAKKTTIVQSDFGDIPNHDWANSADRTALPKVFNYRFDPLYNIANPVMDAAFTLADGNGNEVKSIQRNFATATAPSQLLLDFSTHDKQPGEVKPRPIANGWYRLTVRLNNVVFEERTVWLSSDLSDNQSIFGIVEITAHHTASGFHLIESDGSLRRITTAGQPQPPVFQIRLAARRTYWRYYLQKAKINNQPYSEVDFLDTPPLKKQLVTKAARQLSAARNPVLLQAAGPSPPLGIALPNPERLELVYDQGQYYSELFL